MKPNREVADRLLNLVENSKVIERNLDTRAALVAMRSCVLELAGQLIPYGETYGHAERLHRLTEG